MAAVPKNKISRVERGKRRSGNRPSLIKNLHQAKTPLHKRGLSAQMFKRMDLSLKVQSPARKTAKKAKSK